MGHIHFPLNNITPDSYQFLITDFKFQPSFYDKEEFIGSRMFVQRGVFSHGKIVDVRR